MPLSDPYELCEAAGLAEEAGYVSCDQCGAYADPDEMWSCWLCNAYGCEDCGQPCSHFDDRMD